MSKEVSEKKKTNPLVYILGIPVGILIVAVAITIYQNGETYRNCNFANPTQKILRGC